MIKKIQSLFSGITIGFSLFLYHVFANGPNGGNPSVERASFPNICEVAGPGLAIAQNILLGIATPLGIAAISWGGFLIATSGMSPHNFDKGKTAVIMGIVGLALVYGAYQLAQLIFTEVQTC